VGTLGGQLELHPLPAYSPDLNPDEFGWSHMKNNVVSKKPLRRNESLKTRVEQDLNRLKGNKKLVRSFFGAETVVCAKD
jgi:transposase